MAGSWPHLHSHWLETGSRFAPGGRGLGEFTTPAGLGLRSPRATHSLSEDEMANLSLCLDNGTRVVSGSPHHPPGLLGLAGQSEPTLCKLNRVVAAEVTLTVSWERRPRQASAHLNAHTYPSSPPDPASRVQAVVPYQQWEPQAGQGCWRGAQAASCASV